VALPASETALPKLTSNFSFEVCTRNRIKTCHRATNFKITKGKISISAQIISFFPLLRTQNIPLCSVTFKHSIAFLGVSEPKSFRHPQ
jgi:hypothetical protein